MDPSTPDALARGRELFDRGRFFEAHEVWEEEWLRGSGRSRQLLQGLIQIAAALHKVSRAERPGGAARLFDAGLAKLDGISDAEAGFPLQAFVLSAAACREAVRSWAAGESEPPGREADPRFRDLS